MKDTKTQIAFAQEQLESAMKVHAAEPIEARIRVAIAALRTALETLK